MSEIRGIKRRAALACDYCKWRKIKCNVEDGVPCSSCHISKIDCTTSQKSRRKRNYELTFADRKSISQTSDRRTVLDGRLVENAGVDFERPPQIETGQDQPNVVNRDRVVADNSIPQSFRYDSNNFDPALGNQEVASNHTPPFSKPLLPAYLDEVPDHLLPVEIDYLVNSGTFIVPDQAFRDALIRSYAEFVHPYTPLLDLTDLANIVHPPHAGKSKYSLLLFHAVLFAGSAHVDVRFLRTAGFLTRKSARKVLFHRAKTLYDFEYERRRIPVIQSLLLMSFWYETPDEQKDAHHWLGVALSLAQREGLDRNSASMNFTPRECSLRKRIWWSFMVRGPLVAIGLKRPMIVPLHSHSVPSLLLEDLEVEDESSDTNAILFAKNSNGVENQYRMLRLACLKQVELCECLGAILIEQYEMTPSHRQPSEFNVSSTRMILQPTTNKNAYSTVTKCFEALKNWYKSLGEELKSIKNLVASSSSDTLTVFGAVLLMLYHVSIIILLRPWIHPKQSATIQSTEIESYEREVREAARAITEIAVRLHGLDLIKHIPQTGITALVSAAANHIRDVSSDLQEYQLAGVRGFEQCLHLIQELRDNFYSADFSATFTEIAARAVNISKTLAAQRGLSQVRTTQPLSNTYPSIIEPGLPTVREGQENHFDFNPYQSNSAAPEIHENLPSTATDDHPINLEEETDKILESLITSLDDSIFSYDLSAYQFDGSTESLSL